MATLRPPPPSPGAALPPPLSGPSRSVPCLDSMAVDGDEPEHGTDGVGKVVDQEIDGEPQTLTDGGGDPKMRTDAGGGKRKMPYGSSLVPTIIKTSRKSASPGLRYPMQVTSSPGVNFLVKSAAVKMKAVRKANLAGSPKTPQSPSCPELASPSLDDISPDRRAINSQASKRKRRKLISDIWREAEPIYKDGKLVEGKCNHCQQIFSASRDNGTSHMKRHLKVCEAKTAMNEMVVKMGRPDAIDPDWKFIPKLARRKLLKLIVINKMSFSLVEYTPFREFIASLNPWFEDISQL